MKQQKEAMKEALGKKLEEPMMMEDTPDPIIDTKSCYSCGEEGHISQDCPTKYLGDFPTEEVQYNPKEIEVMINLDKKKGQVSGGIRCLHCSLERPHCYCKKYEPSIKQGAQPKKKRKTPWFSTWKDLSHITCHQCNKTGHYSYTRPEKKAKHE